MNENSRSVNYMQKRMQAIRNMEQHVQKILFPTAKRIVELASKYRVGNKLSREAAFLSAAKEITAGASESLSSYTMAYSVASCKILGVSNDNISNLVTSKIHGATMAQRNASYLANFAEDIVRMVKAGVLMGYSSSQILSAVRTGYKNPYKTSVVTKAQRKDINISTPSYGKGVFRNAYENIVRNVSQVISLAWGQAEQQYGRENGAIGFRSFRASSYPCAVCDDEAAYVHQFGDPYPPYHVACVCYTQFIYKQE